MVGKLAKWFILVWTILCVVWFVAVAAEWGKQIDKPMSDAEKAGTGLGMMAGSGMICMAWVIPIAGAAILYLVFKPKERET